MLVAQCIFTNSSHPAEIIEFNAEDWSFRFTKTTTAEINHQEKTAIKDDGNLRAFSTQLTPVISLSLFLSLFLSLSLHI